MGVNVERNRMSEYADPEEWPPGNPWRHSPGGLEGALGQVGDRPYGPAKSEF